jgi:hypothetical protein
MTIRSFIEEHPVITLMIFGILGGISGILS